jgi:hypothetical protein
MEAPAQELVAIAETFALPGPVTAIAPLGNGNVNDTYRVDTASGDRFVLQRLNTAVFPEPELVMRNLQVLSEHAQQRPMAGQRWEVPSTMRSRWMPSPRPSRPGRWGGVWGFSTP